MTGRPAVHQAALNPRGHAWTGRPDLWTGNDRQQFHAVPAGDRTRTALCGARVDLRRSPPAATRLTECPDCSALLRR